MNTPDARLNEKTLRLLEKALALSPADWETRAALIEHHLASEAAAKALDLLKTAPEAPATEDGALLQARVELETNPADALRTLQAILARNKACALAYLFMARIYRRQGQDEDARKKYGAATLLDESLSDPEWEAWLGNPAAGAKAPTALPAGDGPVETADDDEDDDDDEVSPEEIEAALRDVSAPDEPARPRITFADIGGMKEVIERIRMNIVYPFKNPQVFQKFNKVSGGGILLYGPPGCGKTHIARATAGECAANFIPIAITDVLSKWLGESEGRLHEIFESARRRAPSIIFIDEIDAIGVSRSDASATMATIVNVLLTEMDGVSAENRNVMVLAATNAPWRVDSALRRPGRFDRVLFVPPPDAAAREAILSIHLKDLPVDDVDTAKIAKLTEKFSGADLRGLVARAAEQAILAEMKTGVSGRITHRMVTDAIKGIRPTTTEWLETARNYASYGNRSGVYDELVAYFESGR